MEKINFLFALEWAKEAPVAFMKATGGRGLAALLVDSGADIETICRAGVCPADAVELCAARADHTIIGRRTHYTARRPRAVIHRMAVERRAEKARRRPVAILHKAGV